MKIGIDNIDDVVEAAAEYIEILENHINNLKTPNSRFRGYIGPHDSDIAAAKGKWCTSKAIMELG